MNATNVIALLQLLGIVCVLLALIVSRKQFIGSYRGRTRVDSIPLSAPSNPKWTAENTTELRRFLSSSTGTTFIELARCREYVLAIQTQQSAAVGETSVSTWSDCLNWINSLSQVTGEQVTNSKTSDNDGPWILEQSAS